MIFRLSQKQSLTLALVVIVLVGAVVMAWPYTVVQRDYFVERRGRLASADIISSESRAGASSISTILLHSANELAVTMRLLLPAAAAEGQVPLLLLVGGHRTGKDAVELVGPTGGIAYAAIDYPYSGKHRLSGFTEIAGAVPAIQSALLDTPPALMLAMDWLARQTWYDPRRTELVGVSLGVPFAAVAGALDSRFSRVWLIHGASDNAEWLMHAARDRVHNPYLRQVAVSSALFISHGRSFRTLDWIRETAPRPVVVVLARDDERMPEQSAADYTAGPDNAHVSVIWTEGLHIEPNRTNELRQIIDIVQSRIERTDEQER